MNNTKQLSSREHQVEQELAKKTARGRDSVEEAVKDGAKELLQSRIVPRFR